MSDIFHEKYRLFDRKTRKMFLTVMNMLYFNQPENERDNHKFKQQLIEELLNGLWPYFYQYLLSHLSKEFELRPIDVLSSQLDLVVASSLT